MNVTIIGSGVVGKATGRPSRGNPMNLGPYKLGPIPTPDMGIYVGDCRDLSAEIPDNSVDLIFTDPVYESEWQYHWLAETSARILKPDGILLTWQTVGRLPETFAQMIPTLTYRWTLIEHKHGPCHPGLTGISTYTPCVWFDKSGTSKRKRAIADTADMSYGSEWGNVRNDHPWAKSPKTTRKWLTAFSDPEDIIFDPFCGGGTVPAICKQTRRNWLGFEISPDYASMAQRYVTLTQPALFQTTPTHAQAGLWRTQ